MANWSNVQILGAVLSKFAQPIIEQLGTSRLSGIPVLSSLESKIRSSGWVSGEWTIAKELAPFSQALANALVTPILMQALSGVPDEAIPALAHEIVDKGLMNEKLELFEGKISFDKDDLKKLKALLNVNLPCTQDSYIVKDIKYEATNE